PKVLQIIADNLKEENIPHSLIGAFALSLYGLPKFTADIDLLTEGRFWPAISKIMERLGYKCFQKTKSFAQFDSELGAYGRVDFMFVNSPEGRDILKRSIVIKDELLGDNPVIQPTDYIILKLMAIANNPERCSKDEGDILDVLNLYREGLIPGIFKKLDKKLIFIFADRFGQMERIESLFDKMFGNASNPEMFEL
ncbi:MAG: hypothetical protein JRJ77_13335, partial [Deltaproteobacteria bacterium]|nr:hypothetical protein [Deltaproteobacteria bacterium]MBW2341773.1 hypothetical protein [Deltaproteobacteria bacterium]